MAQNSYGRSQNASTRSAKAALNIPDSVACLGQLKANNKREPSSGNLALMLARIYRQSYSVWNLEKMDSVVKTAMEKDSALSLDSKSPEIPLSTLIGKIEDFNTDSIGFTVYTESLRDLSAAYAYTDGTDLVRMTSVGAARQVLSSISAKEKDLKRKFAELEAELSRIDNGPRPLEARGEALAHTRRYLGRPWDTEGCVTASISGV